MITTAIAIEKVLSDRIGEGNVVARMINLGLNARLYGVNHRQGLTRDVALAQDFETFAQQNRRSAIPIIHMQRQRGESARAS
jgi:hypothetical protein